MAQLKEQLREIMKERGEIELTIQCDGQNEDTKVSTLLIIQEYYIYTGQCGP